MYIYICQAFLLIYLGILLYFLVFRFYVNLIIVKRYERVAEWRYINYYYDYY